MSVDRSNVAILKNVIRIGETGVLFKDIKLVRYNDGDETVGVELVDGDDSGWFNCTLEQFDTYSAPGTTISKLEKNTLQRSSMSVREKILEFIKVAGPKGVQNSAIAAHIGGKLDAPKQHLEELTQSGDIFKRNDMIYWSFVHKDFI